MTGLSEQRCNSGRLNESARSILQPCESIAVSLTTEPMSEECYEFASFRLFPKQRTLLRGTGRVAIGGRAFDLLVLFVSQAGTVVGFNELMRVVWSNITVDEGNLRVQINILRKVLSQCEEAQRAIETIPLRGYCFTVPVRHRPHGVQSEGPRNQRQPVLPLLPNPMIGRDDAIQIIGRALDERRLVTITGPGGIGKTTVAIATAKCYAASLQGSISFVDLSHATDGAEAALAIARALQLEPRREALPDLCEHLELNEMLLILDTCEHIVEPVARLAEVLLSRCSNLKLLVTSREALRATGEWTHRLPSLTFPAKGMEINKENMASFSAVTLFVDRVQSSTRFEPKSRDLPLLAEICRRLDGIPLALEFAAARVADLGLREIAARLDNCFAILTRGRRTALPRHSTLAAAFDWSYSLLSEDEQRMLAHLAALGGSFTAERAIASCLDSVCERPSEAFYGLFDKSFLAVEMAIEEPMFRLLETTRTYAASMACSSQRPDRALLKVP
jgi:predicted ATPase/DNA-binding winged helix-turn-helix (wHTH) protein